MDKSAAILVDSHRSNSLLNQNQSERNQAQSLQISLKVFKISLIFTLSCIYIYVICSLISDYYCFLALTKLSDLFYIQQIESLTGVLFGETSFANCKLQYVLMLFISIELRPNFSKLTNLLETCQA